MAGAEIPDIPGPADVLPDAPGAVDAKVAGEQGDADRKGAAEVREEQKRFIAA